MPAESRGARKAVAALLAPVVLAGAAFLFVEPPAVLDASPQDTMPTTGNPDVFAGAGGALQPAPVEGSLTDDVVFHRGDAGVAELEAEGQLEQAALYAGIDVGEFAEHLAEDDKMFVTADLMTGFVEESVSAFAAVPASSVAAFGGDAFALNSRPSSPRSLYLDFTGHTTTDTYWNSAENLPSIVSQPFDTDGDPNAFGTGEHAAIFDVWRQVADDYALFDVNVTTVDPGVEGLRRTGAGDTSFGIRVVISPTNWLADIYGSTYGGISYVKVFSAAQDVPAFVFSRQANSNNPSTVALFASHEAGHAFGLSHDGRNTSTGREEYYTGHSQWAPIMGGGSGSSKSQWSRGEYVGATNAEDDIAVVVSETGLISDDYPDRAADGPTVGAQAMLQAMINSGTDVDSFNVYLSSGNVSATVRPLLPASNAFAKVTVLNQNGQNVVSAAPTTPLNWTAVASGVVPAGWYTIQVSAASLGTPSTGFSSYGSVGPYELRINGSSDEPPTVTFPPAPTTPGTTQAPATTQPPATTSPPPTVPPPVQVPPGSRFTALAPARLADTRAGLGGSTRLPAGGVLRVQVTGRGGVPSGATSAVLNVVAVNPAGAGFVTTYPCSAAVPDVSTLNFADGRTVANSTIATLSSSGQVCVFSHVPSDIVVDITGWLGPAATSRLQQIGPVRVADTRSALGGSRRLAADATATFDLAGQVPAGTTAVALNITAVTPAQAGFVTVYPCDSGRPETSSLNFAAGETRPNNAIVSVSRGRFLCVYTHSETDVIIDLTGAMNPQGLSYQPGTPARLIDTRRNMPVFPGRDVLYGIRTPEIGANDVVAASVNVTAVNHSAPGFTTTFDCVTLRETSTLNQVPGIVSANGAIVPVLNSLASCVYSQTGGDIIVDLNGWWVL